MASPLSILKRLVGALEALSLEEQTLLQQRQFQEVVALQEREAPLAEKIAELVSQPKVRESMDTDLRARVRALISSCQAKASFLDGAMAEARIALAQLDRAAIRVRAMKPAYGRAFSRHPFGHFTAEG